MQKSISTVIILAALLVALLGGSLAAGSFGATTASEVPSVISNRLDDESQTVYVTDKGKKYHLEGCRYLKDSKRPLSLSEARKTHAPCKVCKAPK